MPFARVMAGGGMVRTLPNADLCQLRKPSCMPRVCATMPRSTCPSLARAISGATYACRLFDKKLAKFSTPQHESPRVTCRSRHA